MCISPNSIKVPISFKGFSASKIVSVPCGHCYECVRKRKLDWEIRLTAESSASAHTFFGMLTYSDEFYHSDIDRDELAYYIKRLRYNLDKYYPGAKLKYFLVSEFGELRDRLHYHVLYFVSEEFDDTHREFEELCKMSWVKHVPLSAEAIAYRKHCFRSWCKRSKPDKLSDSYHSYFNWSRRRYDDLSIGFATCQMLKGGSAVGSIHYACKYIQKQYNKMFYSHLGYDAWIKYMIDSKQFEFQKDPVSVSPVLKSNIIDYPTFPVRGNRYPVPKRWLVNSIGCYMAKFYSRKLFLQFSDKDKFVDENRLNRFWFDEPDRLSFLEHKDISIKSKRCLDFVSRFDFEPNYNFDTDIDLWQMSMIPKLLSSFPDEASSISATETLLPLKWD